MKAARVYRFGPPEVVTIEETAAPLPGDDEVLVRVAACGVGPWDAWVRAGKSAIEQPLPLTLGSDLSGTVTQLGSEVCDLSLGQPVFGVTNRRFTGASSTNDVRPLPFDLMQVGIDTIGLAFSPLTLELSALAKARGVDPAKYEIGLGTVRASVPPVDEDTVTLAVRAARAVIDRSGVAKGDIGMCIVGTETAVDHSKPIAAYVHGLIGLPTHCRIFETKHACYGATAGLQNALDWIRSGSARGRKALIIGADIARYGLGTPGEPTQGAGAVAMIVSEAPRLLAMDRMVGTFARDVYDFWRPLYSKDAVVDGHFSVTCYLESLEGAYRAYRELAGDGGHEGRFSDRFAAIAYHVPYGKMAIKAHAHLRAIDGDLDPGASFERQVAPSLALPKLVGNIYTGSVYLALASALSETPADLEGQSVALFSYGSGSCAEFISGAVVRGAQAFAKASRWRALIDAQRRIGVPEYEAIMRARETVDVRAAHDDAAPKPNDAVRYLGVKEHRRVYA